MKSPIAATILILLTWSDAEARVVRLRIERREPVLAGRSFGLAGPYEKLVGKVDFALDPSLPQNRAIVDLALAPRNSRGEVEFSADFYLLKPVDPRRGNGRLFYQVPNRGGKGLLSTFQGATGSLDPRTDAEFGNGLLMRQGFALLWMGWQWDVPDAPGLLRMQMPIATNEGKPITGLVRANIILGERAPTASLGDRNHHPYPVVDPSSAEHTMTVRSHRLDPPQVVPRTRWRFADATSVALDGGFEPGKIYDVVYRSRDPRVVGCGLAGTRDLISFFKRDTPAEKEARQGLPPNEDGNPLAGIRHALALGVSQSGRFLRHFLYQGFNEDESGKAVFDGVFIQVAGAGRGSFNHRFGQASRDGYRHFNLLYPTDVFPFTDAAETDSETGVTDGLLARATGSGTAPKIFHVMSSFEYWNRAGSLVHTDPGGAKDAELPANTRVYLIASSQHGPGPFPPAPNTARQFLGQAPTNPNAYFPAIRALFHALDRWVADAVPPPPSLYPRVADGTLVAPASATWPAIPGASFPRILHDAYRVDFGPSWGRGIVELEPPRVGRAFGARAPAVDADGNERAGLRLPEIAVPLATQTGWNFRHPDIGAPDELAGVIGSYFAFARTRADRQRTGDARLSIEERYRDKHDYIGKVTAVALELVKERYLLAEDLPEVIGRAAAHYEWATRSRATSENAGRAR